MLPGWKFVQHKLPNKHWVTVARGPVEDVVDSHGEFSSTLRRREFTEEEWSEALLAPSPSFKVVPVGFLVPPGEDQQTYYSRFRAAQDDMAWG